MPTKEQITLNTDNAYNIISEANRKLSKAVKEPEPCLYSVNDMGVVKEINISKFVNTKDLGNGWTATVEKFKLKK